MCRRGINMSSAIANSRHTDSPYSNPKLLIIGNFHKVQ